MNEYFYKKHFGDSKVDSLHFQKLVYVLGILEVYKVASKRVFYTLRSFCNDFYNVNALNYVLNFHTSDLFAAESTDIVNSYMFFFKTSGEKNVLY